jgi:hypothetical protein
LQIVVRDAGHNRIREYINNFSHIYVPSGKMTPKSPFIGIISKNTMVYNFQKNLFDLFCFRAVFVYYI